MIYEKNIFVFLGQNKFTIKNTWLCNINRHNTRYSLKKHNMRQSRIATGTKKKCWAWAGRRNVRIAERN